MTELNQFELSLGQSHKVVRSIFSLSIAVIYAGMVSEDRYSLAVICSVGNNSYAYNLFFTKSEREITLPKGKLRIEFISSKSVRFSLMD